MSAQFSPEADDTAGLRFDGVSAHQPTGPKIIVAKGPPGTGKTTWLVDQFELEAEKAIQGAASLGFMPFSNAAVDEAKRKMRLRGTVDMGALDHVRTMHSAACSLTRTNPAGVMNDAQRAAFRSEQFPSMSREVAKRYDSLVDRGRRLRLSGHQLLGSLSAVEAARVDGQLLQRFYAAYLARLTQKRLITFEEVLVKVLMTGVRPDIEVLFVDEAQDLSVTGALVVGLWGSRCSGVYVAGDDDQSIYGFAGGDGSYFQQLYRDHGGTTLEQSHRVPRRVHALACKVIEQVKNRLVTPYEPTEHDGEVIRGVTVSQLPRLLDGDTNLVLARDGWALGDVKKVLKAANRSFAEVSGESARADRGLRDALKTLEALRLGVDLRASEVRSIVERRRKPAERQLLERLAEQGGSFVSASWLLQEGAGQLLAEASARRYNDALGKLNRREQGVLQKLMGQGDAGREITLSTIHSAKGAEADVVAIVPDRSVTSFSASENDVGVYEDELRLLYVAMTRARRRLILLAPLDPTRAFRGFRFPL